MGIGRKRVETITPFFDIETEIPTLEEGFLDAQLQQRHQAAGLPFDLLVVTEDTDRQDGRGRDDGQDDDDDE